MSTHDNPNASHNNVGILTITELASTLKVSVKNHLPLGLSFGGALHEGGKAS